MSKHKFDSIIVAGTLGVGWAALLVVTALVILRIGGL